MYKPMLSTAYWLTFPTEVRQKLVKLFTIPRSAGSQVEMIGSIGKLVSDGHTPNDLTAINIDVLQKMLGSTSTDFYGLFQQIVDSVDKFLEIKESGAVDADWNFTQEAKRYDEEGRYKVMEDLTAGDVVRVKNGEVYKVARAAGRPKKNVQNTKAAA